MMSSTLGRAFTTKRAPKPADISTPVPKRSVTTKHSISTLRNKISAPLELVSTTNMLSYNAPDIYPNPSTPSARSSSNSGDESDRSPTGTSTPLTSPDTSSVESSPTSLEPNHLSCYFGGPQSSGSQEAPIIPQRALSHTKRTAEALARQRSIARISSSTKSSISSSVSSPKNSMSHVRPSVNMFAANVDMMADHHPFGKELAQVSEIAEEYGLSERMAIVNSEEQEMASRSLLKFSAAEYICEIQGYIVSAFGELEPKPKLGMSPSWI